MKERKNNSMFIGGVTEYDVMKVVNNLKKKVSKDCNDIDMTIIKTIIDEIVTPFTYICNQSFLSGTFPNKMKLAKVIPLYKTGKQNAFTNYRPVSLLPQFSKILEKLFSEQLDVFIEKQNILCESQYGFRSNRSTSMALLELIEEITSAVDNKKCTIGVFIDLKKAFDTIDHKLLLTKLEHYGIRGVAYDWIKSYLCERKQYVSVNSCNSEDMNVVCGVPQGSILGPKLFILYVNDIANVSSLLRFVLFADDTNIILSGDDAKEISNTLSIELDKLNSWFAVNKLSLNVSKTNYMIFGNKKIDKDMNIRVGINGISIDRVYNTHFLGVTIDDKLNWKEHIKMIQSKLSKTTAIIYKASHVLTERALYILYCSLALPYMSYCAEIWGNTYRTNVLPVFIKQKRLLRIVCRAKRFDHTTPLFYKMHALKLFDLIKLKTAVVMFKAYNNMLPVNLQKLFVRVEPIRRTRNVNMFERRFVRTELKSMSLSNCGVKLWNGLEINIKSCRNVQVFKKCFKEKCVHTYD